MNAVLKTLRWPAESRDRKRLALWSADEIAEVAEVSAWKHELMAEVPMLDVAVSCRPPMSTIGLGRTSLSSRSRVPRPPAREVPPITAAAMTSMVSRSRGIAS